MKTQIEIEDRIRSLLKEELDRRVAASHVKLPRHCRHNHQQPLDTRRTVDGEPNEHYNRVSDRHGLPVLQTMGLCMLGAEHPNEWQGTICDEPIDAQQCPDFCARKDALTIEAEFREQARDTSWLSVNLPEVHTLLWTLEASEPIPVPDPPKPAPEQAIETYHAKPLPEPVPMFIPTLPGWKRWLLSWLLGVPAAGLRILPPPEV